MRLNTMDLVAKATPNNKSSNIGRLSNKLMQMQQRKDGQVPPVIPAAPMVAVAKLMLTKINIKQMKFILLLDTI